MERGTGPANSRSKMQHLSKRELPKWIQVGPQSIEPPESMVALTPRSHKRGEIKMHQQAYKHIRKSDNFHEMEGSLTQRDSERMMASPSQTNSRLQFQKRNNELRIQELKLTEI